MKYYQLILFILFSFICSLTSRGMNDVDDWRSTIDSIHNLQVSEKKRDSLLIDAYLNLSWALKSKNPQEALLSGDSALSISERTRNKFGNGCALVNLGVVYWQLADYPRALYFLDRSHAFYTAEAEPEGVARSAGSIGLVYYDLGQYNYALEFFLEAKCLYEQVDHVGGLGAMLHNIGLVYHNQSKYDEAIDHLTRSMAIQRALNNPGGIAYSLNSLGMSYHEMGDYPRALSYYNEALRIRDSIADTREIACTRSNIGYTQLLMGNELEALNNLSFAMKLYQEVDDKKGLAEVQNHLGMAYFILGDLSRANLNFQRSLLLAESLNLKSLMANNYMDLAKTKAGQGDYTAAYNYQERHLALRDSLHVDESRRKTSEMQLLYEKRLQDAEIELLKSQHEINSLNLEKQNILRNFLIIVLLLLGLFLLFFIHRYRGIDKTNRKLERSQEEITESNTQLHELISVRDKLFSIISHDLRNPFASIISFSRVLKRDIDHLEREELVEMAGELDLAVMQINNLLENLLQWSRTQTGNLTMHAETFSLSEVVEEAVSLFSPLSREKEVNFFVNIPSDLFVRADINMTNVILRNYFSNALKYSDSGGEVHVQVEVFNDSVHVSVRDAGVGISGENQARIFSLDRRLSTHGTRDEKGSGLGLLLCKEFAELQGGEVWFSSEEGRGSVFYFSLPVSEKI